MQHDHEPLQTELRNQHGEPVEPTNEVTYSSTYQVLDTSPSGFDPTGSHRCVFCASPDWRWILQMRPTEPNAPLAWAAYLVACDTCQRLCRSHQLDALRKRIVAGTGTDWLLEYLDELLQQVELAKAADGR